MKWTTAALVGGLLLVGSPAWAQAQRTPLKNLVPDQIVTRAAYCRGEYRLVLASGEKRWFPELNLRFKTDGSAYGPERGKPVLLRAGMQGDRAQVIFSGLDDLKRFLVEGCEGDG